MQARDDPLCFFRPVLEHEPSRGLGDKQKARRDDDWEYELEAEGETPLERPAFEVETIVHPVGEAEGGGVA